MWNLWKMWKITLWIKNKNYCVVLKDEIGICCYQNRNFNKRAIKNENTFYYHRNVRHLNLCSPPTIILTNTQSLRAITEYVKIKNKTIINRVICFSLSVVVVFGFWSQQFFSYFLSLLFQPLGWEAPNINEFSFLLLFLFYHKK